MWTCIRCSEEIDDGYEVCWACGTTIDGVEDPAFGEDTGEATPAREELPADRRTERLIVVGRFRSLAEAHALKVRLEAGGVPAIVDGDHAIHITNWLALTPTLNYEVKILEGDVTLAQRILGVDGQETT